MIFLKGNRIIFFTQLDNLPAARSQRCGKPAATRYPTGRPAAASGRGESGRTVPRGVPRPRVPEWLHKRAFVRPPFFLDDLQASLLPHPLSQLNLPSTNRHWVSAFANCPLYNQSATKRSVTQTNQRMCDRAVVKGKECESVVRG